MQGFGAQRGRWLRGVVGAAAVGACVGLAVMPAGATAARSRVRSSAKKAVTLTPWEQAEQGREKLASIPESKRTKADYARTMNLYRAIYHAHPGDLHAAESVYQVALLLAEQGHVLQDEKSSQEAVGQYEFLRKQYPGSSLRVTALLAEGQIEQDDLHDVKAAKASYALLLKKYPHSEHAEEAKAALAEMERPATKPGKTRGSSRSREMAVVSAAPVVTARVSAMPVAMGDPSVTPEHPDAPRHAGQLAMVTGIRHWSTPTYTRVAIDLGDEVQYEAGRVPNPERIYFDLHGTRLAQELAGKSFQVTDDGFLKRIRVAQFSNDMTRVVLDVNDVTEYSAFLLPNPYRLIIDIHGTRTSTQTAAMSPEPPAARPARDPATVPNTVATRQANNTDVAQISSLPGRVVATPRPTSQPISAVVDDESAVSGNSVSSPASPVVDIAAKPASTSNRKKASSHKGKTMVASSEPAAPVPAALPTADGETSLVRALGLKIGRIVIDPGHGGHDSGTLGVDGIQEKDIVLDVALRLGKLLHDRLGSEIVYTRSDDTFIPLETRTAIANKAQADLFISIHANSSRDESARGVETYYLNFTSDQNALDVAARENAVSTQSVHDLSDMVKKIALKEKIDESREFASDVEESLYDGLAAGNAGLKNRGVKKAPFVVLIGANMPSILAEISFVTNPRDAAQLQRPAYRERVAESLYRGVAKYAEGLSGMRPPVEQAVAPERDHGAQ